MKRFALLTAAALLLTGCASQTPPPVSDQVQKYYDENVKNAAATLPAAVVPLVSVVGDSYSGNIVTGGVKRPSWADVVKSNLAKSGTDVELKVHSSGGSGYVNPGTLKTTFGKDVAGTVTPETDVVVFFGSRNDAGEPPAAVGAAASAAYKAAATIAPSAKLVVIGPPWVDAATPPEVLEIRDALKEATVAAKGTFVDPLDDGWFQGANASKIGSDGIHPNESGHAYMAGLIEPVIAKALPS